jgi:hypothetical protein
MVKKLFIIALLIVNYPAFSQEEERKPVRMDGRIMDSRKLPVSYAHVINASTMAGCVGDYEGRFNLGVFPGDTLLISAVSFGKKQFILPGALTSGEEYHFILDLDTIMLSEYVVYAWPGRLEAKMAEVSEMAKEEIRTGLQQATPSYKELVKKHFDISNFTLAMPGPFSLLYSTFSKEAKTRRALEKIILQEKVEERYNADLISHITGLTDMLTINKLIDYCSLQPDFIFTSNDYELYSAILYCYREFIQQKETGNSSE